MNARRHSPFKIHVERRERAAMGMEREICARIAEEARLRAGETFGAGGCCAETHNAVCDAIAAAIRARGAQ